MARDIEEFLRKAAERRAQQKQGGGAPPPAATPPQRPKVAKPAERPKTIANPTPARQQPVMAEAVEVEPNWNVPVAQHVQQHLDTSRIAQQTQRLGEEVGLADEKMEEHLQQVFQHRVGQLASSSATDPPPAKSLPSSTSELFQILRQRKTLRQAILLTEILKRPDF